LADFYHQALIGTRFETYGVKRIDRDLLSVPGRIVFDSQKLARFDLLTLHQFAKDLAICFGMAKSSLMRYEFENPR
jgi:hypothetical protein